MEFYKSFHYNFSKMYKVFTFKKQLNKIFFIAFFATSFNIFFNILIISKMNKLIDILENRETRQNLQNRENLEKKDEDEGQ